MHISVHIYTIPLFLSLYTIYMWQCLSCSIFRSMGDTMIERLILCATLSNLQYECGQ